MRSFRCQEWIYGPNTLDNFCSFVHTGLMANDHYEVRARVAKVARLVEAARVLRLTAAEVAGADSPQAGAERMSQLVKLSGVREPSPQTWRLVVRHLERDEQTLASYAAALAEGVPMPRTARAGRFSEWSSRGIVGDRVGAVA
jgi:hypothetical protein